ncbi:MAG: type I-F CRISPR-associated protein Csy3 [Spirochaetales bacterium]|jgi:CRISPR-associated protein Csy3|nr:type I-F CRISPR-associated protein Csy3 [Spirochaetales bacterium]
MAKKENTASVLAFEKKLVPSDGFMYGTTWENRDKVTPLKLKEKSVRGTISNRLPAAIQKDPLKLNAKVESPNLQRVDSCGLAMNQDTLKLSFTLKVLSGVQQPSACNNQAFNESYTKAVEKYIATEKFTELGARYAENIANGRFLWRNRVGAEKIEVRVKVLNGDSGKEWIFDASTMSTKTFSPSPEIAELGAEIAKALAGGADFLLLDIAAFALIGKAQDVYPSEELVLDKGNSKSKKSKILYDIDGVAGMHSQKIGNALRTIDTWYPDFAEVTTGPIAVEPYGAVTNLGKAYRNPQAKADFFTLFDGFARGEKLADKNEEHYVLAVLVRGGVFGESDK